MGAAQPDLFEHAGQGREARKRALLGQLIAATRLYHTSGAVIDLMAFAARLRAFAPFNAMLLHVQRPGLTHAATAEDWAKRFGRAPKLGTRPLLVLRTKGPVDFVLDVLDTEGRPLPPAAFAFPTLGSLTEERLREMLGQVERDGIRVRPLDASDAQAGWIRVLRAADDRSRGIYEMSLNANHDPPTRFVTLAHELAHLFLGHLGPDARRRIPNRHD